MSRIVTDQDLIGILAYKPNPLNQEGVSGLTVECHPNPGLGHLFTFLALTYTSTEGLITRKWTPCASGSPWEGVVPCSPSFIRSEIARIERAALWEQNHYHPLSPEELIMCDPEIYLIRIKDAEKGREKTVCMIDPDLALEKSVRALGRAIRSLIHRRRRGFIWRFWLHSLVQRFPV